MNQVSPTKGKVQVGLCQLNPVGLRWTTAIPHLTVDCLRGLTSSGPHLPQTLGQEGGPIPEKAKWARKHAVPHEVGLRVITSRCLPLAKAAPVGQAEAKGCVRPEPG